MQWRAMERTYWEEEQFSQGHLERLLEGRSFRAVQVLQYLGILTSLENSVLFKLFNHTLLTRFGMSVYRAGAIETRGMYESFR